MALGDPTWDFQNPASRERLLGVLRSEIDQMLELVSEPARWEGPTACAGWEARDIVGHLVDTTEAYLPAFELARSGGETAEEPLGLQIMAQTVDEGAKAFRKVPQDEMLDRLRDDIDQMMGIFDSLSEDDWASLMVAHKYMGPLPAMFYAEFQLVDYAVHGWDVRQGLGLPHAIDGDAADLLVPLIFVLWQATADTSKVAEPYSIGVRVSGNNGGDVRFDVSPDGLQFAPGDIDDCPAIIEFDPATLVLAGYGRLNGGTVRGDRNLVGDFRSLFTPI